MSALAERADRVLSDTDVFTVAGELSRLNAEHAHHAHRHAASRTLNLIVLAPSSDGDEREVRAGLELLGPHLPARTLVLRREAADRLDAALTITCSVCADVRATGACSDEVILIADAGRLDHAASLVAPLLAKDLPTVLWLPAADGLDGARLALAGLVDHVVLSSEAVGLARAAELAAGRAPVHDVEWGRLVRWRTQIAAAFESAGRREMIGRIDRVTVSGQEGASAVLLAGWVAGRLGWTVERLEREDVEGSGAEARRPDGTSAWLSLESGPTDRSVLLAAGAEEVRVAAPVEVHAEASFVEAVNPEPRFVAGYPTALRALAPALQHGRFPV